jgi:murein DD-endopeptidase MepM/ murein hydrolase activator NlpD
MLAILLTVFTLSAQPAAFSRFYSAAVASVQSGAAPEPFLYLPFDTPQGWRYPSAWFDHHFPAYQGKAWANHPDEFACLEGKLAQPMDKSLVIGPGLEFPRLHPTLGVLEDAAAPGMSGYWCQQCDQGGGTFVYYDGHAGYDWGMLAGITPDTLVLAAGSGRIIDARCPDSGTPDRPNLRGPEGCSITIKHDSPNEAYTSHYFHLRYPFNPGEQVPWPGQGGVPQVGQRVEPGQVIAQAGSTGWTVSGAPLEVDLHIHFEVRRNNTPVDPWGWTPYSRDPGDPDSDPLQCYSGEKSYNLFAGYEPHCYGCALPAAPSQIYKLNILMDSAVPASEYAGPVRHLASTSPFDRAVFVDDAALPDGARVRAGSLTVKTWRVRNTGVHPWDSSYALKFVSGRQMGAPAVVELPYTPPGETAEISLELRAPVSTGQHKGSWRLVNPEGEYFGPLMWVSIVTEKPPPFQALLEGLSSLLSPYWAR